MQPSDEGCPPSSNIIKKEDKRNKVKAEISEQLTKAKLFTRQQVNS